MPTGESKLLAKDIPTTFALPFLPFADVTKGLFWSRVSSHEGLSPLSGPKRIDNWRRVNCWRWRPRGVRRQGLGKWQMEWKSTTFSPTLWSGQLFNVHQLLLGPRRGHSWCKNNNCWGETMTFCHGYNRSVADSDACSEASKIRALHWAFTTAVSCALWSMCIEYVGTSDGGTGFPNIAECFFRWSQSSWAMQSWDLRPQIEADSKGPWMYVSRCEILSHFLKGTNLWRAAYEADVSNG